MDECVVESSPKRMKISNEPNLGALNLTINSEYHRTTLEKPSEQNVDNRKFVQTNTLEMKKKFQQWVLETYRDASKTKTITAKKYERIVKTLRGEIKNCAENSKFRFWMKCKGFKLESEGDNKTLYVLDKKDEGIKYKKVAIVENFFDIIYNVHVNEGARGIQHAGQKRTHKSITETYAFLPREAVTKFLLCCVDCQKRITEDRKHSPLASSSSSHDSALQNSAINDTSNSLNELSKNKTITRVDNNIFECYPTSKTEPYENKSTDVSSSRKTFENNNNIFNETKDCIVTPNVTINFNSNSNAADSITQQNTLMTPISLNDDFNTDRMRIRKRKRKFTRKIVRPRVNVDPCDVTYDPRDSVDFLTSTPRENCDIEANFAACRAESSNDSLIQRMQPPNEQCMEFFTQKFTDDDVKFNLSENIARFDAMESNSTECTNETTPEEKSNFNISTKCCPYLSKISEIIFNPVKYAISRKRKNCISISNEEDFLEQQAVNLVLKAQELGAVESKLTENEKQQISQKVYNLRIISFFLNYAADLMLKSLAHEI
ncbi:uncharacterized protein LOC135831476 [Planococcus citri]|uniref:uncharacterized protein LOC135831476 n=1 Tax=Planococcus citri TaxID=170843 RepID=UPI0031F9226A